MVSTYQKSIGNHDLNKTLTYTKMKEGDRLRQFIENQPKSKISIARDMKVSKQTLFQYFKSKELTKEIKDRFEGYFGKKIFTEVSTTDTDHETIVNEPPAPYNSPGIDDLAHSNRILAESNAKMVNAFLDKLVLLETIKSNLDKVPDSMGLMTDLAMKSHQNMMGKLLEAISDLKRGLSTYSPPERRKKTLANQKR